MSSRSARPPELSSPSTSWSPGDLKRVGTLLSAVATFAVVAIGAIVVGCNAHELDCTDAFTESPRVLIPLVVVAMVAFPAAFAWRWRAVWQRSDAR